MWLEIFLKAFKIPSSDCRVHEWSQPFLFLALLQQKQHKEITVDGVRYCKKRKFFFFICLPSSDYFITTHKRAKQGQLRTAIEAVYLCRYANCYCHICITAFRLTSHFIAFFFLTPEEKPQSTKNGYSGQELSQQPLRMFNLHWLFVSLCEVKF